MKITAIQTRIFTERESLVDFVGRYIPKVSEGAVIVVTSKIVALAEGRTAIAVTEKEKEALIRRESQFAVKTKYTWLTIKDGTVMANAGVDESNARGKIVLLPKDSFRAAAKLRSQLMKKYKVKKLGILITDSRLLPLRAGVVGVALGYAGFCGIRDYRGSPDIFGRKLEVTQTDIADGLATAAVLVMGEGRERQPLALITEAPIEFSARVNRNELVMNPAEDVYQPLFARMSKKRLPKKGRK